MIQLFIWFFLLVPYAACSSDALLEKRVQAHLLLNDPKQALIEVDKALKSTPDDPKLRRLQIECLAANQDIPALLKAWKSYCTDSIDRKLIEDISWAIIRHSSNSHSPIIRQQSIIAAFIANDAKGIPLCLKALKDPNNHVRYVALTLSAQARDDVLKNEVFDIFLNDPSPITRLIATQALAGMRLDEAQKPLQALLESKEASTVEKMAAITALGAIVDTVDPGKITELLASNRAFLRTLACQLVLEHMDVQSLPLIIPCIFDQDRQVRLFAMQCVGVVGLAKEQAKTLIATDDFQKLLSHHDTETSLIANWLVLVSGSQEQIQKAYSQFHSYLRSIDRKVRLLAASALVQAGPKHASIAAQNIKTATDPLVKINLARSLIWNRYELSLATSAIIQGLKNSTERLSWHQEGIFSYVCPTLATHVEGYERVPETEDLFCRLSLYRMLAAATPINLAPLLQPFLQERSWGVSAESASLMIQEGVDAFETLKEQMIDPCSEVALQAAFILALYSQDKDALKVFETQYKQVPRHLKEQIIIGIGAVGSTEALFFLNSILDEPFETLRVAAARSILLCLYH